MIHITYGQYKLNDVTIERVKQHWFTNPVQLLSGTPYRYIYDQYTNNYENKNHQESWIEFKKIKWEILEFPRARLTQLQIFVYFLYHSLVQVGCEENALKNK